ncbi:MAG: heparinase II/III family protein [Victivallales bacterium]|nr:heparinase II/III family protein [Victivallales bacterium]
MLLFGQGVFGPEVLSRFRESLQKDEAGRVLVEKQRKHCEELLSGNRKSKYQDEIFQVVPDSLVVMAFASGEARYREALRAQVLDVASRPIDFWLHSVRFKVSEDKLASLQSGELMLRMVSAYELNPELFSAEELQTIREAVREKGLGPGLRYLEHVVKTGGLSNWAAVIGMGTYYAARSLGDKEAAQRVLDILVQYRKEQFETDGSYGEGPQYLEYPVGTMFKMLPAMTPEDVERLFGGGFLERCGEYLAYCLMRLSDGTTRLRILFRDGQQFLPTLNFWSLCQTVCPSPMVREIARQYGIGPSSQNWRLYLYSMQGASRLVTENRSLQSLPLTRAFANGECYIRSAWEPREVQLGVLLSGGRTKVGFAHNRPNRNGFGLAAFGEYLVVQPGHTSYRSKLHQEWDLSTLASNAVTVDGANQLFPTKIRDPKARQGEPVAKVLFAGSRGGEEVLVSEACGAYAVPLKSARREVHFCREQGYWVILDRIVAEQPHQYDAWWHLNNRDGKGMLTGGDGGLWTFRRPAAEMKVFVAGDNPVEIGKGILHDAYAYEPGGAGEGKPGSSIQMHVSAPQPCREWRLATLFWPYRPGQEPQFQVRAVDGGLEVSTSAGKQVYLFESGE